MGTEASVGEEGVVVADAGFTELCDGLCASK